MTTPADEPVSDPQELAARFVQACAEGETPDVEAWAARLPGDDERAAFRRLVADARMVGGLLPRQVGPGLVLAGRYRIEREIGSGGMGKVYAATDLQLGRAVAVKVLAAMSRASFDPLELFQKESRLLASLSHPNIVAIHEAGTDGELSYLVMELVDGRSLDDVLDRLRAAQEPGAGGDARAPADGLALARALEVPAPEGRTSLIDERSWWRTVARVMVELAATLEATHAKGVVHRDLKPSNIMLCGDGSPVLLDFGLAGSLESGGGAVTRGFVGSAAYLAPEQVSRRAVGNDPRTDVYQLGLVLYELLTLRRAFPAEDIHALIEDITKGCFARPRSLDRSIPIELEAICLQSMELDADRRYATARELREDLERYLGGQELPRAAGSGTVSDLARRSRYFARRHRTRMAVAAAVLLIVAAGAITPFFFGDSSVVAMFEPYRYHDDGTRLVPVEAGHGDPAQLDDVLGVLVRTDTPVYLYVLSVFGRRDPPDWVSPMEPQVVVRAGAAELTGQPADEAAAAAQTSNRGEPSEGVPPDVWGLRVEPSAGGVHVACTRITQVSADVPYEGLWVIASAEPQPHLAAWMTALDREVLEDGAAGVPYARAREIFSQALAGPLLRGESPRLTAQEMEGILAPAHAPAVFDEVDWPFVGSPPFRFFFRVERPLADGGAGG